MTTIVDLFAGPGGLDLAARQLGHTAIGIEYDPDACATRRAAGLPTVQGDVRHHRPAEFPDATTLVGGPPCQTFSTAGTGTGRQQLDTVLRLAARREAREDITTDLARLDDDRTGLILEPLRWILEAADAGHAYRTIVLEQVPAVLPVWEAYAAILRREGYHVAVGVLRSEEHGVPQTRRRAFLAASLDGPVALPAPTHRPYVKGVPRGQGDPRLLPWVSMAAVMPDRPLFVAVSNYGTGGDPKARGRRASIVPAATVTGKVFRTRLEDGRGRDLPRWTPSEAGRLQGFPADYPWTGRDLGQQIGNACPVQLGAAVLAAALTPARAAVAA